MSILTLPPDAQLMQTLAWTLSLSGSSALIAHIQRRWLRQVAIMPLHVACKILLVCWGLAMFGFRNFELIGVTSMLTLLLLSMLYSTIWFAFEKRFQQFSQLKFVPPVRRNVIPDELARSGIQISQQETNRTAEMFRRVKTSDGRSQHGECSNKTTAAPRHLGRACEIRDPEKNIVSLFHKIKSYKINGTVSRIKSYSIETLFMIVVVAISEEILFRQFLFIDVFSDWPLVERALFISTLFAISHIGFGIFPCVIKFFFSLYLCCLLWLTGTVLVCIAVHVGFNVLVYRQNARKLAASQLGPLKQRDIFNGWRSNFPQKLNTPPNAAQCADGIKPIRCFDKKENISPTQASAVSSREKQCHE